MTEAEHPAARAGEWIAEAIADLAQVLREPASVAGLEELTRQVARCADEMGAIRRALEAKKEAKK